MPKTASKLLTVRLAEYRFVSTLFRLFAFSNVRFACILTSTSVKVDTASRIMSTPSTAPMDFGESKLFQGGKSIQAEKSS